MIGRDEPFLTRGCKCRESALVFFILKQIESYLQIDFWYIEFKSLFNPIQILFTVFIFHNSVVISPNNISDGLCVIQFCSFQKPLECLFIVFFHSMLSPVIDISDFICSIGTPFTCSSFVILQCFFPIGFTSETMHLIHSQLIECFGIAEVC